MPEPTDEWAPVGIDDLEPAAMDAVRHPGNAYVKAGPGAGKSEFLAQRAAYLLMTGRCAPPQRILAISFKKDAADNLRKRVRSRVGPALGRRFVSMTFDAFAKSMLDRFRLCLPPEHRPRPDYEWIKVPNVRGRTLLETLASNSEVTEEAGLDFESRVLGRHRLSDTDRPTDSHAAKIAAWWSSNDPVSTGQLTFFMINRLAELAQRASAPLARAIRVSFPYVFVDEFQDTTYAQFDLLESLFGGSDVVVTAVGDNKQRIMGWAGARPDAFDQFASSFVAQAFTLRLNRRSSTGLVALQHVVAVSIDSDSPVVESSTTTTIDGDHAWIWRFRRRRDEAETIAAWIHDDVAERGTVPGDYALLVRQKSEQAEGEISDAFAKVGLRVRNDSKDVVPGVPLQDLLASPLTGIVLPLLRLMAGARDPGAWTAVTEHLTWLRDVDADVERRQVSEDLGRYVDRWRQSVASCPPDEPRARSLVDHALEYVGGPATFRSIHPAYRDKWLLDSTVDALRHQLGKCSGMPTWPGVFDHFAGRDAVSLLTIHKSKGLEYDTVIMLGLDDNTWWSHRRDDREGASTLFVAISRAKQRMLFSHAHTRGATDRVSDLYALLHSADVREIAQ
ncbi:UvrD-helicase domain-containing protein [Pseudonocardia sp.]|uniref:UvrD-helicase domain-containing protein n=1 Tax=Pseudonocardia sp. TaxID=60912 RepID=UPI003D0EE79F